MAHIPLNSELTMGVSVVFIPLSIAAVSLRFVQRFKQKSGLAIDDWLIIPAFVCVLAMQVTMIIETANHQLGYPSTEAHGGELSAKANHAFYPVEVEQIPAIAFIKLSVVFFYRRIFARGAGKWFAILSWTVIGTVIAWAIAFFFVWAFLCRPNASAYWESSAAELAQCVATQKLHNSLAISDAIIDVVILLMALPVIWGLQMTMGRKLAVTACFSLGLVTVAASITRMVVFIQIVAERYVHNIDLELIDTACLYWSMIEVGLGFVVANLMVSYALFASMYNASVGSLRGLLSASFMRSSAQRSARSSQRGWPPKHHVGGMHTTVELQDRGVSDSAASNDEENVYQIKATTTMQQSTSQEQGLHV